MCGWADLEFGGVNDIVLHASVFAYEHREIRGHRLKTVR